MSSNWSKATVVVFARAPEPGRTKTRLIPLLGAEGAANLHARLVLNSIEVALAAGIGAVELWCAPHTAFPFFAACARGYGIRLRAQGPGNLGVRMLRACRETLTRAPAIVIGTDCPGYTASYLIQARDRLAAGADAVLGPAEDGGYVLLGLRRVSPRLFQDLDWGTGSVLEATRERLQALGWRSEELPALWDMDRPEDFSRLTADPALRHLTEPAET
ncbi:MAG TPA: TIGR04282 family arsenosugar biosynthesis glycosyltransferase [Burkholderiales bacterium]|nr:TIGR04282 family arsenosugar biosynthesis glycosyltransferase [Burkholderiales bacterium]